MDKDSGVAYKNTSLMMNIFVPGEIKENEYSELVCAGEILFVDTVW